MSTTNVKTGVVSLVVNSVDSLFYYVLPYLDSSKMYTYNRVYKKLYKLKDIDNILLSDYYAGC